MGDGEVEMGVGQRCEFEVVRERIRSSVDWGIEAGIGGAGDSKSIWSSGVGKGALIVLGKWERSKE